MFRSLTLLTLLLPVLHSARLADAQPVDSVYVLPGVTVVATRFEISALDAPNRITRIDGAAFNDPRSQSVADVIARNSSIFVRQYGPAGLATLSARGTSASQSLVLVDGLPLTNPQLGQIDLGLLPRSLFQSADILSGAGSAKYGNAAVGSVVSLSSRSTGSQSSAKAEFQIGSFGERGIATSGQYAAGELSASIAGSILSSSGDFKYRNTAAFPVRWDRRQNADVDRKALLTNVSRRGMQSESSVSFLVTGSDRGLPTIATIPSRDERQTDRLYRLSAQHRIRIGRSSTTVRGVLDQATLVYENPSLGVNDTGLSRTALIEAEYERVSRRVLSTTGFSIAYQTSKHPSIRSRHQSVNAAAFTSVSIPVGRLLLYPSFRADVYGRPDGYQGAVAYEGAAAQYLFVPSPQFGVNVRINNTGSLRAKASAGRSFRMPTFNDLYWSSAGAQGNSSLKPEDGWSADFGFHFLRSTSANSASNNRGSRQESRFEAELTAFGSAVRDQIVWVSGTDATWQPKNLGTVRSRGIEFATNTAVAFNGLLLSGRLHYSFTDARELGSDGLVRGVRYVPRNLLGAGATVEVRQTSFGASITAASERLVTTDGVQGVPGFQSVDLTAGRHALLGSYSLVTQISVLNVLNESYAVVKGYPMPQRSFRLTIRFRR